MRTCDDRSKAILLFWFLLFCSLIFVLFEPYIRFHILKDFSNCLSFFHNHYFHNQKFENCRYASDGQIYVATRVVCFSYVNQLLRYV